MEILAPGVREREHSEMKERKNNSGVKEEVRLLCCQF